MISIARIFGAPGDRAARERGGEQVERVRRRRRAARSRWTRGAGPRPSARAGRAAAPGRCPARRPGRGRCAGRRRSSRSRPGPCALASSSRASARSSARVRPRGRVPLIGSVATCRPRRPPGTAPARRTGSRAAPRSRATGPRSRYAGEQRRVAGPEAAVQRPRVAAERGLEAAGQVGLVDLAAGDGRRARPRRRRSRRRAGVPETNADGARPAADRRRPGADPARGRAEASTRREHVPAARRSSRARVAVDGARPPSQAVAGPAVPGDRPVVEREAQHRQVLVHARDRRQPLEPAAEVVGEVADEAAGNGGAAPRRPVPPAGERPTASSRASSARASANGSGPSAGASSTATGSAVR